MKKLLFIVLFTIVLANCGGTSTEAGWGDKVPQEKLKAMNTLNTIVSYANNSASTNEEEIYSQSLRQDQYPFPLLFYFILLENYPTESKQRSIEDYVDGEVFLSYLASFDNVTLTKDYIYYYKEDTSTGEITRVYTEEDASIALATTKAFNEIGCLQSITINKDIMMSAKDYTETLKGIVDLTFTYDDGSIFTMNDCSIDVTIDVNARTAVGTICGLPVLENNPTLACPVKK